jgi:signal transduction histidine kinase
VDDELFGSDLWKPALDRYADATGLSVELYGADAQVVLASTRLTPLAALFREYAADPGLFAECARRCLVQDGDRAAVIVSESHGLTVVGASLALEGVIVGAAVAGYALDRFTQVPVVQRWGQSVGVPFQRLWDVARRQSPMPARRLALHGELLQLLGDALLRENQRTRQQEDAAHKLRAADAAKDEFLAILSHELRTPLAAIAGWVNVLKRTTSNEHLLHAVQAIDRNVLLQTRMIEDLLDVSRIVKGSVTLESGAHALAPLIEAAVEASMEEVERKSIRVDFADAGAPLYVQGDAGRLQQVFRNLVGNAVKFTPSGGQVRVALAHEAQEARVTVTDSGAGIAPEFLPFVFDLFRQQEQGTRRAYQGLGIGLALVKRLVELHGGSVSIASGGSGRGTQATIRLPLAAAPGAAAAAVPAAAEPAPSGLAGLVVLVIEDSPDSRESLRDLLRLLGARVAVAGDGREALDMIGDVDPDIVLCDLRMPHMDGYEFIDELSRTQSIRHPPVLAMSALASAADVRRTEAAGFQAHLAKPFDEAAVVAAVNAALRDGPADH